jgi:hypothetical protein
LAAVPEELRTKIDLGPFLGIISEALTSKLLKSDTSQLHNEVCGSGWLGRAENCREERKLKFWAWDRLHPLEPLDSKALGAPVVVPNVLALGLLNSKQLM